MMERERGGSRVMDVPVSALDREGDRERVVHPQPPYDREHERRSHMESHRQDVIDRERVDASERERDKSRENEPEHHDREPVGRDKERASVPMTVDSQNDAPDTILHQDPMYEHVGRPSGP